MRIIEKFAELLIRGGSSVAPLLLGSRNGPATEWPAGTPVGGQALAYDGAGKIRWTQMGELIVPGLVAGVYDTGTLDSNAAIMQEYAALSVPLYVTKGIYGVSSGFVLTNRLRGDGFIPGNGTQFIASGSMPYICSLEGSDAHLSNLLFHGNTVAHCDIQLNGCGTAHISDVRCYWARYDGIMAPIGPNNIQMLFTNVALISNGTAITTGTASGSAGGTTITFVGAPDLTTFGFRTDSDGVHFASEMAQALAAGVLGLTHEIVSVSPTQLEIYPPLEYAISGSAYVIKSGNGINFLASGTNGSQTLVNCLFQNNVDAGLRERGLYGNRQYGSVYEANGAGQIVGHFTGTQSYPLFSRIDSSYGESNTCGDIIFAYAGLPTVVYGPSDAEANLKIRAYGGSDYPIIEAPIKIFFEVPVSQSAMTLMTENNLGRVTRFHANCTLSVQSHSFRVYRVGAEYELFVSAGTLTIDTFPGVVVDFLGTGVFHAGTKLVLRCVGNNHWELLEGYAENTIPITALAEQPARTLLANPTTSAADVVAVAASNDTVYATLGAAASAWQKVVDALAAFASPDGKVVLESVAPAALQSNAALADAATFDATYALGTNDRLWTVLWECRLSVSTSVYEFDCVGVYRRDNAGVCSLVDFYGRLPGDLASPPAVTITSSCGAGGPATFSVLNNTGIPIGVYVRPTVRRKDIS